MVKRSASSNPLAKEVTVIAIDGPAGAGKSTVAQRLAESLGLDYLDTGAMYRAVTFGVLERHIPTDASEEVAAVAREAVLEFDGSRVLVDGQDATQAIRGTEVTQAVSAVAANPGVRAELVKRQRLWIEHHGGGVLEGRDIGTVVAPDADLKLFITASPRVRAERRVAQTGGDVDLVEASIIERDRRDSTRDASPLLIADDAVTIDTSEMDVTEVLELVHAHLSQRLATPPRSGESLGQES